MDFRVQLDYFRGPLDLLLYLVRKHELDVCDLPIALVTEQYLNYLEVLEKLDTKMTSAFAAVLEMSEKEKVYNSIEALMNHFVLIYAFGVADTAFCGQPVVAVLHTVGFDHLVVVADTNRETDLQNEVAGLDLFNKALRNICKCGGLIDVVFYAFKKTNLSTHFCRL